jgi:hypothetical protein
MGHKSSLSASPPIASGLILRLAGYQPPCLMPGTAQFRLWVQSPTRLQETGGLPFPPSASRASSSTLRPIDSTAEGNQKEQKPMPEPKKDTKKNVKDGRHTIPVQMT